MNRLSIVAILLVGAISTVGVAIAAAQPLKIRSFTIVNHGSGLCLESVDPGLGEPIVQRPCNGSPAQKWANIRATATHDLIQNRKNGVCLDVRDGINANRTVVQQWSCRNVPSMRWTFPILIPEFHKAVSSIGSRCLDVAGGSLEPGAPIQIYRCTPGTTNTAQIWAIQKSQ